MSAAEMVGRLLERYALSMDEIEIRSARCVQVEIAYRQPPPRPDRRLRPGHRPLLRLQGLVRPGRAHRHTQTRHRPATAGHLLYLLRLRDRYSCGVLPLRRHQPRHRHRNLRLSPRQPKAPRGRSPPRYGKFPARPRRPRRRTAGHDARRARKPPSKPSAPPTTRGFWSKTASWMKPSAKPAFASPIWPPSRGRLIAGRTLSRGLACGERVNLNRPVSGTGEACSVEHEAQ